MQGPTLSGPAVAGWCVVVLLGLASCGDDKSPAPTMTSSQDAKGGAGNAGASAATQSSGSAGRSQGTQPSAAAPAMSTTPSTPSSNAGSAAPATPSSMSPSTSSAGGPANTTAMGMGGAAAPTTPPPKQLPPAGPADGDTSKPMFSIPNVPCGVPNVSFGGVPPANIVKITNRDVFVAYPCAHEGAAVTFYLAIHGTLQEGQKLTFTLTNFPIHKKVDSDNFIVVAPQAIGTQWGNGDNGMDLPHLYEVINWVYSTFGEKLSIRGMWASGGSWGAAYLYNFACDPMLQDRLTGIRMLVGRGCPPCSTRLSCIVGEQELEEGMGMPLTDAQKEQKIMAAGVERYAQMHGCDARVGPTMIGNIRGWTWPNCDKGWAHSYYLGPGEHADRWDDPMYVDHMTKEMKSTDR